MAYVLGYWFADGWMSQPDRDPCIVIVSKDLAHLLLIRHVLEAEQKIYERKDGCYQLSIGSKQMWQDLLGLGGVPAKSLIAQVPYIPYQLVRHFVRGYVDGDGYVYWENSQRSRPAIGIVGSVGFLTMLSSVIDDHTGVGIMRVKAYANKAPFLAYTGIKAKTVGKWLYSDTSLALERKALIAYSFSVWEISKFGWRSREAITPKMQKILDM